MFQANATLTQTNTPSPMTNAEKPVGLITQISINHAEMECINLALIRLREHVDSKTFPYGLGLSSLELAIRLKYLEHWFKDTKENSSLKPHCDGQEYWYFTSSELVDWLLDIIRHCLDEDAITLAAIQAVRNRYIEYYDVYPEDGSSSYSLGEDAYICELQNFRSYYNSIVTECERDLIRKLRAIKVQGYPEYPIFV